MPRDNGPHPVRRVGSGVVPTFDYYPPPGDPVVIHEDPAFVVVDKPAGLLAVPGIADGKQDCVRSRVAAMFPDATGPMTCHRLDLSTSGVMILARDARTHRSLSKQFEFRKTRKRYVALVEGHLGRDEGEITAPMRKDMEVRPLMLVDYFDGKPSRTRFRVLARESWGGVPVTRVQLEPFTGRTHQLRVHAAHPRITTIGEPGPEHAPGLGAPIVGDELYGGLPAPRLMLHASMLTIYHPATGKSMTFRANDPF
jgi:tRNA pseudouridine32 synthase/23S rRNA pseudouridine746 synthase